MKEQLSIAYVFDGCYKPGEGVPNYIETLGDYYKELGHNVCYIVGSSPRNDPNIHAVGRTVGIKINGNRVDTALMVSASGVERVIDDFSPDVLHVQAPYSLVARSVLKRAPTETGVVGTFHIVPNSKLSEFESIFLGLANSWHQRRFDQMLSVSPAAQDFASRIFRIESEVVPCPIDLNRLRGGRRSAQYADDKTNIVFMGRLVERKGCQYLIEALGLLDRSMLASIRVLISGKGPLEAKLKHQASKLDLDGVVNFLGFVDNVSQADFLASGDIAVFPATGGESFGIVLAEAMAAGAGVVIGGNNPGYSYALNGDKDCLFDPLNANELATKLSYLIANPARRRQLHASQQEQIKRFDVSVIGDRVMQAYRAALTKRRAYL